MVQVFERQLPRKVEEIECVDQLPLSPKSQERLAGVGLPVWRKPGTGGDPWGVVNSICAR